MSNRRPETVTTPATKPKKKRRWLRRSLWSIVILGLLGTAAIVVAYVMTPIPKPNASALQQGSTIYYSDGKTVLDRFATVNRQIIPLSRVPKKVQETFLAAEDRSFYSNSGISPKGIARSIWVGLRGGPQQGGSTITQQYVKNYYLTQDRTLKRKIREVLISVKIDKEVSKDQILEDYLNTIYFGRGADGIATAAQAYFRVPVDQLTVSQGALLASVIRGPSYYDPALGAEQKANAKERWAYVMDGMVSQGWITQAERDAATFPKVSPPIKRSNVTGPRGFISEAVKEELVSKLKLTDADIERGGYRIVTTIDAKAQKAAEEAIAANLPPNATEDKLHVGLVAIKPGNGAITAMYGGPKFGAGESGYFNTATDAGMQAGSTFKVWTLIAALERGLPLSTRFDANSPQFFDQFKSSGGSAAQQQGEVVNFGNHSYGTVDMATATALSANTYFAQLNIEVSPERTREAAEKAGLKAAPPQKELGDNYANVFGTDMVRVIDQANAYATIAAEGKRATPYLIASVKAGGEFAINYKAKPQVKQVFDPNVTRDAIQAMSKVVQPGGTAAAASALGRPAAGKTGTTTNNYSAWFDGFTPNQLAAAVGIYRGDGSVKPANQMNNIPGVGELTGGTVPVGIWTQFMLGALEGQKVMPLPPAGNISGGTPTIATTVPSSTSTSSSSSSSESSSSSSSSSTSTSTSTSTTSTSTTTTSTGTSTTSTGTSTTSTGTHTSSSTTHTTPPPSDSSTTPAGDGSSSPAVGDLPPVREPASREEP